MYESILVPLDGSQRAEAVLPFAVDLAKRCQAKVVLFRAVPAFYQVWAETLPGTVDIAPGATAEGIEIVQSEVKEHVRGARRYLSNVRRRLHNAGLRDVHLVVAQGDAAAEIVRHAREEGVGLVAIATHGRSGLVRAGMGRVAGRVIREGPGAGLGITPKEGPRPHE